MIETLDSRLYCDPEVFKTERERIFAVTWQLIAHESELPNTGSYIAVTVAGFPVIVVRDEAGALHAFHNVCRHRAGPLAPDGIGDSGAWLTCRYHGWRYGLDGHLAAARDFGPAPGFDARRFGLMRIACTSWRSFIFVNLDADAQPLQDLIAPLERRAGKLGLSRPQRIVRSSHEMACNWKTYVENYLEGYHVPIVHPALNASLGADYDIEIDGALQFHRAQVVPGAAVSGFWAWMWPSLGINVYTGGVLMERVEPLGYARTRLDYLFLFHEDGDEESMRRQMRMSENTTREDIAICESVQRNLDAGVYRSGVLSPKHETSVDWFHAEIRKALARA